MTTRCWGGMASLGVLVVCVGCATPYKRALLPLGEWNGSGHFVSATAAPSEEEGKTDLKAFGGNYPTCLKIEPAPGGHADSRRLEILSQRGKQEGMEGDRTHLIVYLEPVHSSGDHRLTVYRLTKGGLSFDENPPDVDEGPEGPAHASCLVVDGDLVLRIHYMEGFVDTFRFHGDVLHKDGTYSPEIEEGLIHWSEQLRRKR
ncbi:MAG: hypothetical protein ACE5I3_09855 [Phycisphaerae bacterium]